MIELRLFGGLQFLSVDGRAVDTLGRRPKRAALVAYLAAALPRGLHRRDKLVALFWPELDADHARAALSQSLYVIRSALGSVVTSVGDEEVGIDTDTLWCDVTAFERALDDHRPAEALALYRGELLDGFFVTGAPEFEQWLDRERQRLRLRASEGAWELAEQSVGSGDIVQAERWARRAADLGPADEAVIRRLMRFLYQLGDRAAAVSAYEAFVWNLAREYELRPSSETTAVAQAIRQELALDIAERRTGNDTPFRVAPPATPPQSARSEVEAPADLIAPSYRPNRGATGRVRTRRVIAAALGSLMLLLAWGPKRSVPSRDSHAAATDVPRLMILPFRNYGSASDAYMADGITEEITARLTSIRDLSIVGGRTAARYAASAASPRQIAAETGVSYVLEGSVSWQSASDARRIRVRPRLIRARDDTEVWAAVFDEDLAHVPELFTLLGGIAQRVVDELHVATNVAERRGMASIPTSNQQAYDAYLRGRDFKRRSWSEINTRAAIQMFERAIEYDSSFALAWAWLSFSHTDAEWLNGLGDQHLELAQRAGERALRLDSTLADAHVAMGHYYYVCCADYERAAWHMELGALRRPGDSWIAMLIGNVHKRQGRWDEAARYYQRAIAADPRWVAPLVNLAQLQLWTRRYDDAAQTIARGMAVNPQEAFLHSFRIWLPLLRSGDTTSARRLLEEAEHLSDSYDKMRLPFYLAIIRHDYDAAGEFRPPVQTIDDNAGDLDEGLPSDATRRGLISLLRNDPISARVQFAAAKAEIDALLRRIPPRSRRAQMWLHASRALAFAGLGDTASALADAQRAREMDPVRTDALDGTIALQNIALAYTLVGQKNSALDILDELVTVPARLTPALVRIDPLWDGLRGESRYSKLVRQSAH